MSDVLVSIRSLGKTYRLYSRPHHRFLDVLGLLRGRGGYTEHHALRGIDIDIARGEKVALIGRNGAGKSTLLKVITGVTQPTEGTVKVSAEASALLQIGSTFHPEFSGRDNVLAYLAHLGLGAAESAARLDEIVDFAELEEYIDQPVKTYSTGMSARLMFAASTAMQPDLLVIDEILSVGDAYFAQKSFERISEMCESRRTTVILVSHDVYSASRLCERMVWVDRGSIVIDGPSPQVMKAYEDSIRAQEEARLLKKNRTRLAAIAAESTDRHHLRVEARTVHNLPLASPVFFASIELHLPDGQVQSLPLVDVAAGRGGFPRLETDLGCWGDATEHEGVPARPMKDYGSSHRMVAGTFSVTDDLDSLRSGGARLVLRLRSPRPCQLLLKAEVDGHSLDLGMLPDASSGWVVHEVDLAAAAVDSTDAAGLVVNTQGVHGTGSILVGEVRLLDAGGNAATRVRHGEAMSFEIDYEVRDPQISGPADLLVGLHRDGVHDACKFFTQSVSFDAATPRGTVVMHVDRLPLPNGKYTVSLTLAKLGYYESNPTVFYSVNPDVFTCLSRFIEFEVFGGNLVASGGGLVELAQWTDRPR